HRDALRVLAYGGVDDLTHRAIVPEVDHLGALRLQDAAHDLDGGVVSVEQRGGGHKAHAVLERERRVLSGLSDGSGHGEASRTVGVSGEYTALTRGAVNWKGATAAWYRCGPPHELRGAHEDGNREAL